jgi:hypothetical protein
MKIQVKKRTRLRIEHAEFDEPTVRDCLNAVRISGKEEGLEYQAALLASIGMFDGKKLTMEDLLEMPQADFLELRDGFLSAMEKELQKPS